MPSTNTIYVKIAEGQFPHPAQLGQYGPLDRLGVVPPNITVGYKIGPDGYLHGLATTVPRLVHVETGGDPVARIQLEHQRAEVGWAERDAGQHHPRFYQGGFHPAWDALLPLSKAETKAAMMAEEKVDILDNDLIDVARTAMPSATTMRTFGAKISNVLATACFEVEAQCKGILRANNYAFPKRPCTEDYVKLCKPMRLEDYSLRLHRYPDYPEICPFKGWTSNHGVKGAPGATQTLPWYDAYNNVKHDQERNFELGTLEHAISAVAAVHVLLFAQYGVTQRRQASQDSFYVLERRPLWHQKERTYAPLAGEPWAAVPYSF